ncbi:hypothetical protein TNCV_4260421 [Trichonephila clavipes]|nr:hypothetical protein TNCV_4260421 [Trichonephila clavipes]
MARTKQTDITQSNEEVMEQSQNGHEQTNVTPEQACDHLQFLYHLARSKENQLNCVKVEIELNTKRALYSDEDLQKMKEKEQKLSAELQSTVGEIPLNQCPIENCKIHTSKTNSKSNAKKDNLKKDLESVVNKVKSKLKRAGDEEFKLPKKAARTIKEIPIEQKVSDKVPYRFVTVCTTGNKFSVLEEEEAPPGKSSSPLTVKPIMLKIVNGYNLIVQDINRKFPGTINKMAGNYIKIQPATPDDHRDIVTHLENIRAQHYIIKRLADRPIKVVIKGLPVKTDVAEIESDLI